MQKTIKAENLKVGMYVVLPVSWFKHPFLTNEFVIKSPDQIHKILDFGISDIIIDTTKGMPVANTERTGHREALVTPPRTWEPDKLVPVELKEAIRDKSLSLEKKTKIVYQSSLTIVERLFEDPKAENIKAAKKGIADVVDLIISDNATTNHLLSITSYDYYTYTHSVNVGVFSVLLARELFRGSFAHDMHELGAGFFLHDIGKVRIDNAIINKPGKLSDDERKIIRTHPEEGYKILSESNQLTEECRHIVLEHHERADGEGYPRGLKGNDIHIYGRICSIADVYDALTADRSYKMKLNTFNALKLMKEELLNHFTKELFEKFVRLFIT